MDKAEDRLLAVNGRLRAMAASRQTQTIGSTVAALLTVGQHVACMWAGDSRIYRYRENRLEQLTQDHAFVGELVEKGILSKPAAK